MTPYIHEQDFSIWKGNVDRLMKLTYAITIEDAGIDDMFLRNHWEERMSALEFVNWFSAKYDLIPISEWKRSWAMS
jgi:hypothetical protein